MLQACSSKSSCSFDVCPLLDPPPPALPWLVDAVCCFWELLAWDMLSTLVVIETSTALYRAVMPHIESLSMRLGVKG